MVCWKLHSPLEQVGAPMRRSYVVPLRWMVIYGYGVPRKALHLSSIKLPRPWSPWETSPSRKISHGRPGNWSVVRDRDTRRGWSHSIYSTNRVATLHAVRMIAKTVERGRKESSKNKGTNTDRACARALNISIDCIKQRTVVVEQEHRVLSTVRRFESV
jgi:hypothetical protein